MKGRWYLAGLALVAASIVAAYGTTSAQGFEGVAESSMSRVYLWGGETMVEEAWSRLTRTDDSVSMAFHTTGNTPGEVLTLWWVVFNNPGACSPDPEGDPAVPACGEDDIFPNLDGVRDPNPLARISVLYASGNVVGEDGTLTVSASLHEGEPLGFIAFGPGLEDAKGAEIHMVVRGHGPMDPETIVQQLNTPEADGVDLQFAIFVPSAL